TNNERAATLDAKYSEDFDIVEFHFTGTGTDSDPSRRDFLRVLGAGLVFAVTAGTARAQDSRGGRRGGGGFGGRGATTIDARLHIGKDGAITVMSGKGECGQGARGA